MGIINLDWYAANATRAYPLVDNNVNVLPQNIIVDLDLRFPATLGSDAFISAVSVTPYLVTVIIESIAGSTFTPAASVSIAQPVMPYVRYPMSAMAPGVGGWIVFGDGVGGGYSGLLTSDSGRLTRRAASAYRVPPISFIAPAMSASQYVGLVKLTGRDPVQITAEKRNIAGTSVPVILISLAAQESTAATTAMLQSFAGPCGARAETGNCVGAQPIQTINTVAPDASGNITVEVSGNVTLGILAGGNGVVIDTAVDLGQVCTRVGYADSEGNLSDMPPVSDWFVSIFSESVGR